MEGAPNTKDEQPQPAPDNDQEKRYNVEMLVDVRRSRSRIEYKVKWEGYGEEDNTWEPRESVLHLQEHLEELKARKLSEDPNWVDPAAPRTKSKRKKSAAKGYAYVDEDTPLLRDDVQFFKDMEQKKTMEDFAGSAHLIDNVKTGKREAAKKSLEKMKVQSGQLNTSTPEGHGKRARRTIRKLSSPTAVGSDSSLDHTSVTGGSPRSCVAANKPSTSAKSSAKRRGKKRLSSESDPSEPESLFTAYSNVVMEEREENTSSSSLEDPPTASPSKRTFTATPLRDRVQGSPEGIPVGSPASSDTSVETIDYSAITMPLSNPTWNSQEASNSDTSNQTLPYSASNTPLSNPVWAATETALSDYPSQSLPHSSASTSASKPRAVSVASTTNPQGQVAGPRPRSRSMDRAERFLKEMEQYPLYNLLRKSDECEEIANISNLESPSKPFPGINIAKLRAEQARGMSMASTSVASTSRPCSSKEAPHGGKEHRKPTMEESPSSSDAEEDRVEGEGKMCRQEGLLSPDLFIEEFNLDVGEGQCEAEDFSLDVDPGDLDRPGVSCDTEDFHLAFDEHSTTDALLSASDDLGQREMMNLEMCVPTIKNILASLGHMSSAAMQPVGQSLFDDGQSIGPLPAAHTQESVGQLPLAVDLQWSSQGSSQTDDQSTFRSTLDTEISVSSVDSGVCDSGKPVAMDLDLQALSSVSAQDLHNVLAASNDHPESPGESEDFIDLDLPNIDQLITDFQATSIPKLPTLELSNVEFKQAVKANNFDTVKTALEYQRYDLEQPDLNGLTLIMLCAIHGFNDLIELLVKYGADVNAQSKTGITPLMIACDQGNIVSVCQLVASGAHLNLSTVGSQETAVMRAIKKGYTRLVEFLLSRGCNVAMPLGDRTLQWYCQTCHQAECEQLVKLHTNSLSSILLAHIRQILGPNSEISQPLLPLQCLSLSEKTKFSIVFKHELEPTKAKTGMLLFLAHTTQEQLLTSCRLYGQCEVVGAHLNTSKLKPLTESNFVFSFCPLHNGRNDLELETTNSSQLLLVCAYKCQVKL